MTLGRVLKEIIERERGDSAVVIAELLEEEVAQIRHDAGYRGQDPKTRDMPLWHVADATLTDIKDWRESLEQRTKQ